MRHLLLSVVLLGCGSPRDWETWDEEMTLVANSDQRPPASVMEAPVEANRYGSCLLTLQGPEHTLQLPKSRGYDGTGCHILIGSKAKVTLMSIEGDPDLHVMEVDWL